MSQIVRKGDDEEEIDPLILAYFEYHETRRKNVDFQVDTVSQHFLALLGLQRTKITESDRIAERYPERGWNWAWTAEQQSDPWFVTANRHNRMLAYAFLCAIPFIVLIATLYVGKCAERDRDANAYQSAGTYQVPFN
ncbi:MAG TPA: hypothetical protein EYN91_06720 [Candidatus Melainabacteria bacterium]|jgi:hypothetical protein|nr:hypothetical protein [Candidatus Melainabacteria bacterium]HIN67040.1 hypothetical protein [Candidatus Obscuribacterales bacterium]